MAAREGLVKNEGNIENSSPKSTTRLGFHKEKSGEKEKEATHLSMQ